MARIQITISNDRTVTWENVEDDDHNYLDGDAIVTMTLKNYLGAPVANAADLPLEYVADSNGTFKGVIDSTITDDLTAGAVYSLALTAVSETSDAHVTLDVDVVTRTQ